MEVHAHSHTARKKWTHYFWEFLMLFLAVFCGFMAENLREHKVERGREIEYMKSLIEDLARDTLAIRKKIELGKEQKAMRDSMIEIINRAGNSAGNVGRLYLLSENSNREVKVNFENRTASQLKNAGGMRLVHKEHVADSILSYWSDMEICNDIGLRLERYGEYRDNAGVQIFDNKYLVANNDAFSSIKKIREGAKFIKNDPALLSEYSNRTYFSSLVLRNYLSVLNKTKHDAAHLIDLIKKEYHLE